MVSGNTPQPLGFGPWRGGRPAGDSPASLSAATERSHRHDQAVSPCTTVSTWAEFVAHYEQFTDLLCVAAKDGVCRHHEVKYAFLRGWLLENYAHIAPRLRPFLTVPGRDPQVRVTLVDPVTGRRRVLDCFESVLLPATLDDLLRQDSGDLIDQVSCLSEAVYRCADLIATSAGS